MPTGIYKRKTRTVHIKLSCLLCSAVFSVPPSLVSRRKYCSVDCYRKSQFGKQNALGLHRKYGPRPERNRQQSIRQSDGRFKKENHPRWNHDREEQFVKERTRYLHRSLLYRMMKQMGCEKNGHTNEILGYSANEFRKHMESLFSSGMSWENHGSGEGEWSIDHIRPLSTFPIETSPSIVNALSNLRPIWHSENLRRSRKWNA